jgi:hypothetical protein
MTDFSTALRAVRLGKRARRQAWATFYQIPATVLLLQPASVTTSGQHLTQLLMISDPERNGATLTMFGGSHEDLLAGDWELVDAVPVQHETTAPHATAGLSFSDALDALKAGKRVRRAYWGQRAPRQVGLHLILVPEHRDDERVVLPCLTLVDPATGTSCAFTSPNWDLLADDWKIVR